MRCRLAVRLHFIYLFAYLSARLFIDLFASLLDVVQQFVTLLSLSVGLVMFSPWLMILLVLAVIPMFTNDIHLSMLGYSAQSRVTPWRRQLDYLRSLGASSYTAKEIKVYGLGGYLSGRYKQIADEVDEINKAVAVKRVITGSLLNFFSTGAYYIGYVVVLIRTLANALSIGTFTFFASAFSRSRW